MIVQTEPVLVRITHPRAAASSPLSCALLRRVIVRSISLRRNGWSQWMVSFASKMIASHALRKMRVPSTCGRSGSGWCVLSVGQRRLQRLWSAYRRLLCTVPCMSRRYCMAAMSLRYRHFLWKAGPEDRNQRGSVRRKVCVRPLVLCVRHAVPQGAAQVLRRSIRLQILSLNINGL